MHVLALVCLALLILQRIVKQNALVLKDCASAVPLTVIDLTQTAHWPAANLLNNILCPGATDELQQKSAMSMRKQPTDVLAKSSTTNILKRKRALANENEAVSA